MSTVKERAAIVREHIAFAIGIVSTLTAVAGLVLSQTKQGKQFSIGIQVIGRDGKVIPGALVQLGFAVEVTNLSGIATFSTSGGTFYLFISAAGYAPYEAAVTVNSNTTLPITLE